MATSSTTSRYQTPAQQNAQQDTAVSTSGSGTSTSTTNSSSVQQQNSTNMDPQSLAALQALIGQLMGGGTQQMAQERATRLGEISAVQAQRAGYSKEQAFGDAQGLMAQQLRTVLESLVPSINRAAEGAGTSGGSMRALLLQDAANRAAESSAALGLNAAVQYGGVSNQMNSILEALTRPDETSINALLNALNIAKGAVTSSTTQTSGTSTTTGSTTSEENKLIDVGGSNSSTGGSNIRTGGISYFGPTTTEQQLEQIVRDAYPTQGQELISNARNGSYQSYTP